MMRELRVYVLVEGSVEMRQKWYKLVLDYIMEYNVLTILSGIQNGNGRSFLTSSTERRWRVISNS